MRNISHVIKMARLHLFELEDQEWFPDFIRNYGTDFLQFLSNKAKIYEPIIPILEKGVEASGTNQIIDLASGGGGGLLWLNGEFKKKMPDLKILLTDYFPNIEAFEYMKRQAANFDYLPDSVDARAMPPDLKGLRTQFLSFHHFKPADALKILQNAVDAEQPIAIFEAQERSFASFVTLFFSPISVLLTTPFIKPFKIGRIVFTYLIPLVPLMVWWDGLVSSLRTYSVKEMEELVAQVDGNESYDWDIGRLRNKLGVNMYLLGTKKV